MNGWATSHFFHGPSFNCGRFLTHAHANFNSLMTQRLFDAIKLDKATLLLLALCALTLVPLLVVVSGVGQADAKIWTHLLENQLSLLIRNTVGLAVLTALFCLLIGASLGWLVAVYEFPGSRWLEWALMLPLAVPAYVMAFSQLGLFDFTGPVQTALRALTGKNVQALFPLRSMIGVSLVMSLAFYPYVYLLARNAFKTMGQRALEVGQSLGYSPRQAFWRVAMPMARPWLFGGVMLVVMETLADFGAVSVFNFDTLTSGIYKVWFSLFSLPTAQQLASILLLLVLLIVGIEHYWRGRRSYSAVSNAAKNKPVKLKGIAAWRATLWATSVFLFAFALPVGQLIVWATPTLAQDLNIDFLAFVRGSIGLSALASFSVVAAALALSIAKRHSKSGFKHPLLLLSTIGYAVPGTVLAVGVFAPVAGLDNFFFSHVFPESNLNSIFKGSLLVMMWAYVVRFLAVGFSSADAAILRITANHARAARSLGMSGLLLLRRLHLPLMRGGLLTGLMLVFVDVMKEMPITLMTRPFGWDTLSVRIFSLTSEGLWREAALPALALILAGLLPVLYLTRQEKNGEA